MSRIFSFLLFVCLCGLSLVSLISALAIATVVAGSGDLPGLAGISFFLACVLAPVFAGVHLMITLGGPRGVKWLRAMWTATVLYMALLWLTFLTRDALLARPMLPEREHGALSLLAAVTLLAVCGAILSSIERWRARRPVSG